MPTCAAAYAILFSPSAQTNLASGLGDKASTQYWAGYPDVRDRLPREVGSLALLHSFACVSVPDSITNFRAAGRSYASRRRSQR